MSLEISGRPGSTLEFLDSSEFLPRIWWHETTSPRLPIHTDSPLTFLSHPLTLSHPTGSLLHVGTLAYLPKLCPHYLANSLPLASTKAWVGLKDNRVHPLEFGAPEEAWTSLGHVDKELQGLEYLENAKEGKTWVLCKLILGLLRRDVTRRGLQLGCLHLIPEYSQEVFFFK